MFSLRVWWAWRRQGRPRDFPVVVKAGRLHASPEGHGAIDGFWLDWKYVDDDVACTMEDLWDRLSAMYPVERDSVEGLKG